MLKCSVCGEDWDEDDGGFCELCEEFVCCDCYVVDQDTDLVYCQPCIDNAEPDMDDMCVDYDDGIRYQVAGPGVSSYY